MTTRTPVKYWPSDQSGPAARSSDSHVWRWVSMKPGMAILLVPSMTSAPSAGIEARDRLDLAPVDQDVAAVQIAELRIHRDDGGVANECPRHIVPPRRYTSRWRSPAVPKRRPVASATSSWLISSFAAGFFFAAFAAGCRLVLGDDIAGLLQARRAAIAPERDQRLGVRAVLEAVVDVARARTRCRRPG